MATEAQILANRQNAKASTGPRTPEGKAATSRNAQTFGLFSTRNCVQPEDQLEYDNLYAALWQRLSPADALEELYATEIIRASWRLRRCAIVEHSLTENAGEAKQKGADFLYNCLNPDADPADAPRLPRLDPMRYNGLAQTQIAVDRARTSAHSVLARSTAELRRLQTERCVRKENLPQAATTDVAQGIAETSKVATAMATSALARTAKAPAASQSQPPADSQPQTPRSAPCPCGSTQKYKRCCGHNAPAVLKMAA